MRARETYRSERRNAWRATRINGLIPWARFNGRAPKYQIGSALPGEMYHAPGFVARSKYMPHIGKKQRAKGAATA